MKRTKAQRMLAVACGPALGVLLAVPVGGLLAGAAGADHAATQAALRRPRGITPAPASTTCGDHDHDGSEHPPSSGLAFTGADIEEMAVIGVVAIGVGAVLVRGRRRTA